MENQITIAMTKEQWSYVRTALAMAAAKCESSSEFWKQMATKESDDGSAIVYAMEAEELAENMLGVRKIVLGSLGG